MRDADEVLFRRRRANAQSVSERVRWEPMKFNFGDIVTCEGYPDRLFTIDGWRVEQHYYPEAEWTETVYELTDVYSAEWIEADEEDLTLVATADKAETYIAEHKPALKGGETMMLLFGMGEFDYSRKPRVSPEIERYNKERERERRINELLDARNDYARLLAEFGDDEYMGKIAEIDAELHDVE